jgi:hypothetical protein
MARRDHAWYLQKSLQDFWLYVLLPSQRGLANNLAGLSDYQVRDLNDEINGLLREKRHFETQIVNLGGANYKRGNASMLDDEGKEVPGTRGYKYFGRAKELPGVKEMFSKSSTFIPIHHFPCPCPLAPGQNW